MSDTMLLGVLRMPFEIAMSTLTAQIQYHQRGVQAADGIEKLTRERDEARAEVERLREIISTLEIVGKAADDERARMQKEIERLHKAHEAACRGGELLRGEVERLHAELDAMKAGFEVAWQTLGAKP